MAKKQSFGNQKGVTLIEVTIASVVLAIIAIGFAAIYSGGHKASVSARDQVVAKSLTDTIINRYQTLNYNEVLGADSAMKQGSLNYLSKTTTTFVSGNMYSTEFGTTGTTFYNPHSSRYWDNYYVDWSASPAFGYLEDLENRVQAAGFTRFRVIARYARTDSSDTSGNNSVTDFSTFVDYDLNGCDDNDNSLCFRSDNNTHFNGTILFGLQTITKVPHTDYRVLTVEIYKKNQLIVSRVGIVVSRVKLTGNQATSSESPLKCDLLFPNGNVTYFHNGEAITTVIATDSDLVLSLSHAYNTMPRKIQDVYHSKGRKDIISIQGGGPSFDTDAELKKYGANMFTALSEVGADLTISTGMTLSPFFNRRISGIPTFGYNWANPIGLGPYALPSSLSDGAAYDGYGAVTYFLGDNPGSNDGILKEMVLEHKRTFYARAAHNGAYSPWSRVTTNTDITPPKVKEVLGIPQVLPPVGTGTEMITSQFPYIYAVLIDTPTPDSAVLATDQFPSGLDVNTISISTKGAGTWYDYTEVVLENKILNSVNSLSGWPSRPIEATAILLSTNTLLPFKFDDGITYKLRADFADYVTYGNRFDGSTNWDFVIQLNTLDSSTATVTILSPTDGATVGAGTTNLSFDLADPESGANPETLEITVKDSASTIVSRLVWKGYISDSYAIDKPGQYYTFTSKLTPNTADSSSGGFQVNFPVNLPYADVFSIEVKVKNGAGLSNSPPSWTITRL